MGAVVSEGVNGFPGLLTYRDVPRPSKISRKRERGGRARKMVHQEIISVQSCLQQTKCINDRRYIISNL